jgi:hypothetical protein
MSNCVFCGDHIIFKGSTQLLICTSCNNYNLIHDCNSKTIYLNPIHSRYCSNCGFVLSAERTNILLIKPDDNSLPKFTFSGSIKNAYLKLLILNKKPLIHLNKELFFFENKRDPSEKFNLELTEDDLLVADKNILLVIKKNICKSFCFFSNKPIILPEIILTDILISVKPEFKSINGEGYIFWISLKKNLAFLNCTKISSGQTTIVKMQDDLISGIDFKIFFPDLSNEGDFIKIFVQTSESILKFDISIGQKTIDINMSHKFSWIDQPKLKELHFGGQNFFLCVFENSNVLVLDSRNNCKQILQYSEDNIFNSLDNNLYVRHENKIRIIPWVNSMGDKLKQLPINQNFQISFCAYLEKSDVLFLIYRKPLKFDICIVRDFGLHKWLYDIESSSAQLLLIDNLLYFFLVNDNHKEIGVKILDLNDYIN